jgi:FeS assembly SUF system protein
MTADAGAAPETNAISTIEQKLIEGQVVEALRACYDPEIPVNIYELGLVYEVKVSPEAQVAITMTLTSPACPVAQSLPKEIETRIKAIPGVRGAAVTVVWTPAWNPSMMSEAAKLELGFM